MRKMGLTSILRLVALFVSLFPIPTFAKCGYGMLTLHGVVETPGQPDDLIAVSMITSASKIPIVSAVRVSGNEFSISLRYSKFSSEFPPILAETFERCNNRPKVVTVALIRKGEAIATSILGPDRDLEVENGIDYVNKTKLVLKPN